MIADHVNVKRSVRRDVSVNIPGPAGGGAPTVSALPEPDPRRTLAERRRILQALGAPAAVRAALLAYGENPFVSAATGAPPVLPLAPEPHLQRWRDYQRQIAGGAPTLDCLQQALAQLCVPVEAGQSGTPAYAAVMRRGQPFDAAAFGGRRLCLRRPEALRLGLYSHPAGDLPVLSTPQREDFVTLFRALACRSEPRPLNAAVNAHLIAGLLNWDRVRRYRAAWTVDHLGGDWGAEMQRVARQEPWRFYDRLMLVCDDVYSGVPAGALGLDIDDAEWLRRSAVLRLEHEFTHYATKRVYGLMRLNMFDEIIADWAGITAALGRFRAAWFLRFLNLPADARDGALERADPTTFDGRLLAYRDGLDDDALPWLARLLVDAAHGLQRLSDTHYRPAGRARFLLALTRLGLELLASDRRETYFDAAWRQAGRLLDSHPPDR